MINSLNKGDFVEVIHPETSQRIKGRVSRRWAATDLPNGPKRIAFDVWGLVPAYWEERFSSEYVRACVECGSALVGICEDHKRQVQ